MVKAKLKIRKIPISRWFTPKKAWYFLDYGKGEHEHFKQRMYIEQRPFGDFYLTICFPYLHERGIVMMKNELKLAKQAIKILKQRG